MRSHLRIATPSRQVMLGLMLTPLALAWNGAGHAQTVSLDNVTPIALTSSTTLSAVRIDPSTGNVTVRSSVEDYISCQRQPVVTPQINTFAPTSNQVTPSSTITLNWTSTNTTSCSPQQGSGTIWGSLGTLPTSGSQNITAPASNGTVVFQLNCTNGTNTVSATTQVTVQTGGGGGNCQPLYPTAINSEFNTVFQAWPAFGVRRRLTPPGNGYQSYSFTASSVVGQFGTVATGDFPGDGDGVGQMSISRVPGCFTASELGTACLGPIARLPGVGWQNGGSSPFSCALTPGQTYYINFTYGSGTSGPGPHCPVGSGGCSADVQNQIQD